MGDGDEDVPAGDPVIPDAAFSLVGNEIRATILRELDAARREDGDPAVLSVSQLRSRVDAEIENGALDDHLQQLVGPLVERIGDATGQLDSQLAGDGDEAYRLRPQGRLLTRTIRAGATTATDSRRIDLDLDCYFCGTGVEAYYENALFMATCPECEYIYEYDLMPPGCLADDDTTLRQQIGHYLRHRRLAFASGVCPVCANRLGTEFLDPSAVAYPAADQRELVINRWCDHCGERDYLRTGEFLLGNADLVAFCTAHGVDITTEPLWHLPFAVTDRCVTVDSTDPWIVDFRLSLDGETLALTITDDPVTVERES